jgi:minor histocompatibility antigen H13
MVTVATKLDIPIKLVFQGPTRSSMLGLGDIVVPGMFIALCLRFDNFMYYYRQRKFVPVQLKTDEKSSGEILTTTDTQRMVVKPKYVNPQGQWGNHFWTSRFSKMLSPDATPALKASAFPKPYFTAAMIGYLLAMMATLAMLLVFNHAQPALLYLVPGVVSAVWLVGTVRGELHEMWIYTEDGSLDNEDVIVTVDANGNVVENIEDEKEREKEKAKADKKDLEGKKELDVSTDVGSDEKQTPSGVEKKVTARVVFAFTIEAPASLVEG